MHGWLMPDVVMNVQKIGNALENDDFIDESYKLRMNAFTNKLITYTKMFKQNREVFT